MNYMPAIRIDRVHGEEEQIINFLNFRFNMVNHTWFCASSKKRSIVFGCKTLEKEETWGWVNYKIEVCDGEILLKPEEYEINPLFGLLVCIQVNIFTQEGEPHYGRIEDKQKGGRV